MNIYLEVLIIIILMVIFILWKLWYSISTKRLLKKYNPTDNKTKKGGVFDKRGIGITEPRIDDTTINLPRPEQPEGRELLPQTDISDVGEDSNSTGENSSSLRRRNPIKRLFKRNKKK